MNANYEYIKNSSGRKTRPMQCVGLKLQPLSKFIEKNHSQIKECQLSSTFNNETYRINT